MAYATGSLTDANSSLALYNVLAGLLTTANYTLVDTVVISTRTHKVWKSAAANNSMNLDWYLDVAYTTTGVGPVHLTPFEYFDPATDLGYRGPIAATDSTIETTYNSRYGATGYALETNWFGAQNGAGILTSSTTFGYWLSVTGDRVIALSSLLATLPRYAGFYDASAEYATLAGAKLFPLIKTEFDIPTGASSTVTNVSGLTRTPPATNMGLFGNVYWRVIAGVRGELPELSSLSPRTPGTNAWGAAPKACKLVVGFATTDVGVRNYFGFLHDMVLVHFDPSVVRGDTLTISGETYITTAYNSAYGNMGTAFKAV